MKQIVRNKPESNFVEVEELDKCSGNIIAFPYKGEIFVLVDIGSGNYNFCNLTGTYHYGRPDSWLNKISYVLRIEKVYLFENVKEFANWLKELDLI